MKERWAKMTPEQKEAAKARWESKTPEEKEAAKKRFAERNPEAAARMAGKAKEAPATPAK